MVSGNIRDPRLHGHTSRFPEIRDKVQKMFSRAPVAHKTENTITVSKMSLMIIAVLGRRCHFHLVGASCRQQFAKGPQAEMGQRWSGATLRWRSRATITRAMAAHVLRFVGMSSTSGLLSAMSSGVDRFVEVSEIVSENIENEFESSIKHRDKCTWRIQVEPAPRGSEGHCAYDSCHCKKIT